MNLQYFPDARQYFDDSLFIGNSNKRDNIDSNFKIGTVSYASYDLKCPIRVHARDLGFEIDGQTLPFYGTYNDYDYDASHTWNCADVVLSSVVLPKKTLAQEIEVYVHELGHVASLDDVKLGDSGYKNCIMTDNIYTGFTTPQPHDRLNLIAKWK